MIYQSEILPHPSLSSQTLYLWMINQACQHGIGPSSDPVSDSVSILVSCWHSFELICLCQWSLQSNRDMQQWCNRPTRSEQLSQYKHDRSSVGSVEPEYGFDWWGHDLSVLSKRQEVNKRLQEVLHSYLWVPMTSSGSIHGAERCQVNSTIDNKPVGESAQIVLHITGLHLCEGAFTLHFRQISEEFNFVEENSWHGLSTRRERTIHGLLTEAERVVVVISVVVV